MVLDHEFPSDIRVEKEIETLNSAGHKVDLACYTRTDRATEDVYSGIKIFRKSISNFLYKSSVGALKFPFYFNFWKKFLNEILRKGNYGAIHIHDLPLAALGFQFAQKYDLKFVLDLHENWPVLMKLSDHTQSLLGKILNSHRQWLAYEKKYANLADGLIVVAPEMQERLRKRGVENENTIIVPNTSKKDTFQILKEIEPDPEFLTMLYTGGLTRHRGVQVVIEGLRQMKLHENFRFWIVGSGRFEQELRDLVKKAGLENQVEFFGWQPQEKVFEFIMKSDITLIPHLKSEHTDNTSPNKIFHYMLAQKPVLASDCNYLKRILNAANCGLIYQNNSSEDFARQLKEMIDSPDKRKIWGENGLKAVKNEYNWELTSRQLPVLYQFGN